MKTLLVRTLEQWRDWLTEHHSSVSEVWLIFHKRHTGVASIAYKDARDEALCFGWVDSLVKRLDDRRYAQKFTPRRADSRWSAVNRKRYAELKAGGRLKPPGIERPPYRPRLWSSATAASDALKASGVHPGSAEESPDSLAPLRSAATLATPAVSRLD